MTREERHIAQTEVVSESVGLQERIDAFINHLQNKLYQRTTDEMVKQKFILLVGDSIQPKQFNLFAVGFKKLLSEHNLLRDDEDPLIEAIDSMSEIVRFQLS